MKNCKHIIRDYRWHLAWGNVKNCDWFPVVQTTINYNVSHVVNRVWSKIWDGLK